MTKKLLITPKGRAIYPKLDKADVYTDDTGRKSPPTYKVDLAVPVDDGQALFDKLQGMLQAALEEHEGDSKYAEVFIDEDETPFYIEEEDDETVFRFRLKEEGKNNATGDVWLNKPNVFDARGKKIEKCPVVGGGSILKVSFEPYTWSMPSTKGKGKKAQTILKVGISLRLKGIQILKLEQYSGASAEQMGFGEEEGYSYDPSEFDEEANAPADQGNSDGDEEDF